MTQFFFLTVQGKIKQQVRTDQKHRPAFFLWGLNRAKEKKKKKKTIPKNMMFTRKVFVN